MTKDVLYEKKGRIAYITLNRPDVMNAVNADLLKALAEAVNAYSSDDNLWCAIITGAEGDYPSAFSVGADFKWFAEEYRKGKKDYSEIITEAYGSEAMHGRSLAYLAMDRCFKPIIAAINGYCLAAGMIIGVADSDIRIASEKAVFGLPEARFSASPFFPVPLYLHLGLGNLFYMMLTGKQINAQEALRMGLVSEVVTHENLMQRATELAEMVCESAPMDVRAHKEWVKTSLQTHEAIEIEQALIEKVFAKVYSSEDAKEGPRAFVEKRKPVWKNR